MMAANKKKRRSGAPEPAGDTSRPGDEAPSHPPAPSGASAFSNQQVTARGNITQVAGNSYTNSAHATDGGTAIVYNGRQPPAGVTPERMQPMADPEETANQQQLLATYRQRLAYQLRQQAILGFANTPPGTLYDIDQARAAIRRIKAWLQAHGTPAGDEPNDEPTAEELAQVKAAGGQRVGDTYNFYGGISAATAHIGGEQVYGKDTNMGDHITISNVTNSVIGVKARMDGVTQSIGALPNADPTLKQTLEQLVAELSTALQQAATQGHAQDAETVSKRTEELVAEVQKPQPDKELVEFNLERMKKAAANIAAVLPTVLPLATKIAEHIRALVG